MIPFHPSMADSADSLALDVPNWTLDIFPYLCCSSLAFPVSVGRNYHSPRCSGQNQGGIINIPLISIFTSKPYWNNDDPVFTYNTWVKPPSPLKELWQVTCSTLKLSSTWSQTELVNDIRTSLVVQWLRRHALNAEGWSSIPSQGSRSHMPHLIGLPWWLRW